jgi:hypothetical protein
MIAPVRLRPQTQKFRKSSFICRKEHRAPLPSRHARAPDQVSFRGVRLVEHLLEDFYRVSRIFRPAETPHELLLAAHVHVVYLAV